MLDVLYHTIDRIRDFNWVTTLYLKESYGSTRFGSKDLIIDKSSFPSNETSGLGSRSEVSFSKIFFAKIDDLYQAHELVSSLTWALALERMERFQKARFQVPRFETRFASVDRHLSSLIIASKDNCKFQFHISIQDFCRYISISNIVKIYFNEYPTAEDRLFLSLLST
jgi:hypothetical protein